MRTKDVKIWTVNMRCAPFSFLHQILSPLLQFSIGLFSFQEIVFMHYKNAHSLSHSDIEITFFFPNADFICTYEDVLS